MPTPLPIDEVLAQLQLALRDASTVILEAPPGAGKTTRVPLALLSAPWLQQQKILMLEPRRLAARNAAYRMAMERSEQPGQTVGYRVRFEQRVSPDSRIEVLTEGILTRRLQDDPELTGVGLVIFDEFHERSLHADLALALCREIQAALRPELRLLLMSATIDGASLAAHLDDAPRVRSAGRPYPVEIRHQPPTGSDWIDYLVGQLQQVLGEMPGDVLVFLPGSAEIRRVAARLEAVVDTQIRVVALYGDLSLADQQSAILPDPEGYRRIVLATPIAETSLTIEGVRIVVDSGLARIPCFQPRLGMTRLQTQRISQDAADQRAGRAGRLGAGLCLRLWPQSETLASHRRAEILNADLSSLALELARWGADADQLAWLDAPPPAALQQAHDLLQELQALDATGRITPSGQAMAMLPGHPRLAHMLLRARALQLSALASDLAALLEERDPLRADTHVGVDLQARLAFLAGDWPGGDRRQLKRLRQASAQWREALKRQPPGETSQPWQGKPEDASGLLLALAYPERIARRRGQQRHAYKLSNGRGARLPEHDPLGSREWLVAAHVDAGAEESRIFLAAGVNPIDLQRELPERIDTRETVCWDASAGAVRATRQCLLGSLILDERELHDADPLAVCQAMVQGIRQIGLDCLPWTPALRQWQARVESLRQWRPEEPWPTVDDSTLETTLEQWLAPHLQGIRRHAQLKRLDLASALTGLLAWQLSRHLNALAPSHLDVPSGSRVALRYHSDAHPPVLAARLQELFGMHHTPQVAGGRIGVLVEILSPARRPIQLTADLSSFWATTYAEVRRELRGRYAKHYWPENPYEARAIRGVRPRGDK